MSNLIINPVDDMWRLRGTTVDRFGKDQTGTVTYTFNQQGFRSHVDYCDPPKHALFGCSLVMGVGLELAQTVAGGLDQCYNYGLAGRYSNWDIYHTLKAFCESDLRTQTCRIAVVWSDRDPAVAQQCVEHLRSFDILHFFCGNTVDQPNCYRFPKSIDADASGTHAGPLTHKLFCTVLCRLFNQ